MVTEVNRNVYINSFKSIKFPKSEYVSFTNEFQEMCLTSYLFLIQGGIYIFQLVDFYGSSRMCQSFMAICESLAIGWIVGEYHHVSLKPSGRVISFIPWWRQHALFHTKRPGPKNPTWMRQTCSFKFVSKHKFPLTFFMILSAWFDSQQVPTTLSPSLRTWQEIDHLFFSKSAGNTSFLCCHWWVRCSKFKLKIIFFTIQLQYLDRTNPCLWSKTSRVHWYNTVFTYLNKRCPFTDFLYLLLGWLQTLQD